MHKIINYQKQLFFFKKIILHLHETIGHARHKHIPSKTVDILALRGGKIQTDRAGIKMDALFTSSLLRTMSNYLKIFHSSVLIKYVTKHHLNYILSFC